MFLWDSHAESCLDPPIFGFGLLAVSACWSNIDVPWLSACVRCFHLLARSKNHWSATARCAAAQTIADCFIHSITLENRLDVLFMDITCSSPRVGPLWEMFKYSFDSSRGVVHKSHNPNRFLDKPSPTLLSAHALPLSAKHFGLWLRESSNTSNRPKGTVSHFRSTSPKKVRACYLPLNMFFQEVYSP